MGSSFRGANEMNFSTGTWVLAILAVSETIRAASGYSSAPAPQPNWDCSSLINDMVDCVTFLSGDDSIPSGTCCSGLKTVIQVDVYCICYGMELGSEFGFEINMTRAEAMPLDCGVAAPPISFCNMPTAPAASPATPPPPSPVPDVYPPVAAPIPFPSNSPPPAPPLSPATATPAPSYTPIQPPAANTPTSAPPQGGEPSLAPSSETATPPPGSDQARPQPQFAIFSILLFIACYFFLTQ